VSVELTDHGLQQSRFQQMSDAIITKIDAMGTRIDELERSVADLMDQVSDASRGFVIRL
jgi:heat shock factor-binding protein 1